MGNYGYCKVMCMRINRETKIVKERGKCRSPNSYTLNFRRPSRHRGGVQSCKCPIINRREHPGSSQHSRWYSHCSPHSSFPSSMSS